MKRSLNEVGAMIHKAARGADIPLGLADDPDTLALLKTKEIQNGRLAQVAMAAFFVQVRNVSQQQGYLLLKS